MGHMIAVPLPTALVTGCLGTTGRAIYDELAHQGYGAVSFVASPAAGCMTGRIVDVNGGWMC